MTTLSFTYKDGRGHLQIGLDNLLPCSAGDFKRLLSFVELSDRPADHAEVIYNYIAGAVDALKAERATYDEENVFHRDKISKINATLRKHLGNAAAIVKIYRFKPIEDDDAKITYKAGTVYALSKDEYGKTFVEAYDGWTFKKAGYVFDIYKQKSKKASYRVLLHGTGLGVLTVTSKNKAADEITSRILDVIKKAAGKMDEMKSNLRHYMIAAGFIEDERPESISASEVTTENNTRNEEASTTKNYEFTKNTISIDGVIYPVEYSVTPKGTVFAYVGITDDEDGCRSEQRIRFDENCKEYVAVLAAAKASKEQDRQHPETISKPEPAAEPAPKIEDEPKKAERPEVIYTDDTGAARDPKTARGPIPEKTFIGSAIQGRGWKILFDECTNRTRVIFDSKPTTAARAATENAGFYYSPNMQSWNKKLTFRAYRAAQSLSYTLNEIYAA